MSIKRFLYLWAGLVFFVPLLQAQEKADLHSIKIKVNGQPAWVTYQDLSGLATRPLRLLIQRNNKIHGDDFMRVYATGVQEGDAFEAELESPLPGIRATVYQLVCSKDGQRYLSMPASFYFPEQGKAVYREWIKPAEEEFLVIVFEKTDSPEEKNIQIHYFEDRVRNLVLASYKTNFLLTSLKFKLKDFGEGESARFFERDAQLLVDRFIFPQQIAMIRLWRRKAED